MSFTHENPMPVDPAGACGTPRSPAPDPDQPLSPGPLCSNLFLQLITAARVVSPSAYQPGSSGRGVRSSARLLHRRKQLLTSLLAATTSFGADAAMLVHLGVALALLRARPAGLAARFELRLRSGCVVLGLASQDAASGVADVGAVQVQPDALTQLRDHLLGQTSVPQYPSPSA